MFQCLRALRNNNNISSCFMFIHNNNLFSMQNDKNFLSRPSKDFPRGNDTINKGEAVTFTVKYIGCIEIFASMKVLDFATRSSVAREAIHRVYDATNAKTPPKRHVDKKVQQCISVRPCLEHAGINVDLNISSRCIEMKSLESNEVIARHEMPRISFASGGDVTTLDYIAYVAKDITDWRACYVLECGNEKAQSLITTMGQAFELRYKEYYGESEKKKTFQEGLKRKGSKANDQEYYNDMPGKLPPEPIYTKAATKSPKAEKRRERISSNLIDLDTPILTNDHEYVNENIKDDFDDDLFSEMHTFPQSSEAKLSSEKWFHGKISRTFSESLLKNDGDFLVRESQNTLGQYVLTGMKGNQPKHLLLIDPEGCVRTKDRVFENIPHLINYHWTNFLPIISAESALLLQTPILRTADIRK